MTCGKKRKRPRTTDEDAEEELRGQTGQLQFDDNNNDNEGDEGQEEEKEDEITEEESKRKNILAHG